MERWKFTREFKLEAVSHTIVHVSFAPKADKRADISLSLLCANRVLTRRSKQHCIRSAGRFILEHETDLLEAVQRSLALKRTCPRVAFEPETVIGQRSESFFGQPLCDLCLGLGLHSVPYSSPMSIT